MNDDVRSLLDQDFFDVISSSIKAASFKREDFDKVNKVEFALANLYQHWKNTGEPLTPPDSVKFNEPSVKISTPEPNVIENTTTGVSLEKTPVSNEILSDVKNVKKNDEILTPDEAKNAPARPMPDDIKAIVEAGVEVAKNPPKVRTVKETPLSSDPDEARRQWDAPLL